MATGTRWYHRIHQHPVNWRNDPPHWSAWTTGRRVGRTWVVQGGPDGRVHQRPGLIIASPAAALGSLAVGLVVHGAFTGDAGVVPVAGMFGLLSGVLAHEMWSARRTLTELVAAKGPPPPGTGSMAWGTTSPARARALTDGAVPGRGPYLVSLSRLGEPDRHGNVEVLGYQELSRWPDRATARSAARAAAVEHPDWHTVDVLFEHTDRDGRPVAEVVDHFDTRR